MGCCATCCALLNKGFGQRERRVMLVGLHAAGKTSILYRWKHGEFANTIPTAGFNVETIDAENTSFLVWDLGGGSKYRPLWRHYYQNTHAVIFVVDSTDRERLGKYERIYKDDIDQWWLNELRLLVDGYMRSINIMIPSDIITMCFDFCNDETTIGGIEDPAVVKLHRMMKNDELKDAMLLVLANKQDALQAMSVEIIAESLGLNAMSNRESMIMGCSAKNNEGLQEPLKWLATNLQNSH